MKCDSICICKSKPFPTDTLVECHGECTKNGKFFSPGVFKFEKNAQQPQNNLEMVCMQKSYPYPATTCSSSDSNSSDDKIDAVIIKVCEGETDKTGSSAKMTDSHFNLITSPTGWLDMRIWQLMAFSGLCLVQLEILTFLVVNLCKFYTLVTATGCVSAQLDGCQDMSTSMTFFMTLC